MSRRRATVARRIHAPERAGSSPAAANPLTGLALLLGALLAALCALVAQGCGDEPPPSPAVTLAPSCDPPPLPACDPGPFAVSFCPPYTAPLTGRCWTIAGQATGCGVYNEPEDGGGLWVECVGACP